jgi:hypothetical protein
VKLKEKFRITGFYPDWANPTYQITCHCFFAFMLIVIFLISQEAIRPFLEAFLFSWDSFTFGSAGSLSNIMPV